MRKDRLYLYTFLSLTIIFILMGSIAIHYFVKVSANQILDTQLEFGKREAKELGTFISYQLENGIDKEQLIDNIQNSLESSDLETGFVSIFDWSGNQVCHPDIKQVGQKVSPNQSFVSSVTDDLSSDDFYSLLQTRKEVGGVRNFEGSEKESEVIYLFPIKNSDWILAAHANTDKISQRINKLRNNFYTILLIMGFVVVLSFVIVVRLIGSSYEKRLELKNRKLEDEVINLSKLNRAVGDYQQKVSDKQVEGPTRESSSKKRILTYVRNELLPVPTEEIAHIYTENSITYVVSIEGRRSVSNLSLDELFSNLDSSYFFRANRQAIIAISAIDKIVKYGNNQLKILVNPNSEIDIIISKNKAAEFKQWLNL
ncbi:LytR/AlgR family response regulator transcription factor [Flagellimonas eckloniae]|uniref:Transcriptional regulator n=1 Tax=Flagellimonas eckloniae TaxID=346185 RepID=A0A0Q1BFF6_9FLAO|nr:LytTR family DNA-binding domain-containing protein [Allomuricauda eckloniae]KQC28941.1 transcriptional regulator [Allomuricauda eckloniae]